MKHSERIEIYSFILFIKMSFTGQEMLKTGALLLRGATGGNLWQYTSLLGDISVVVKSKNRFKVYFKQTTRTKQTL